MCTIFKFSKSKFFEASIFEAACVISPLFCLTTKLLHAFCITDALLLLTVLNILLKLSNVDEQSKSASVIQNAWRSFVVRQNKGEITQAASKIDASKNLDFENLKIVHILRLFLSFL
jgi:hypothetical protein